MKRALPAFLLIFASCGTTPDPSLSATVAPTRAEATVICQGVGVADEEIDTLFLAVATSRDGGVAIDENVTAAQASCDGDADCAACRFAVIAAVYGE